jgi:DNA-directed RNA polymerase subunit RPC12/RpoP
MNVAPLHRTLEQELVALLRGASLECLVCGEFVLHESLPNVGSVIRCPECGVLVHGRVEGAANDTAAKSA